jgi:hypothetical protein
MRQWWCPVPGGAHQPGAVTIGWCTVLISPWLQPVCPLILLRSGNVYGYLMKTADVDVPGVVTLGWCTLLISPEHQLICLHIFLHQLSRLCHNK